MRTLLVLITTCLFACTSPRKKQVFNQDNLESYFITIDASRDTVFRTPKGAAIKIKAGTFSTSQELEIKEAYSMKDILLAGLTTESNGAPLRSGGMIYINTKDGKEVTLQKPIAVVLPANGVENGMQLFKGEAVGDSINWLPTDTLQPTVDANRLEAGKALFVANCNTCHGIQKTLTGPALAGVSNRGPWKNNLLTIANWVRSPGRFMAGDNYTKKLFSQYGSMMTAFPQLENDEILSIIDFVENEAQKPVTDTFQRPVYPETSGDSTGYFYRYDTTGIYASEMPCNDTSYYSERDSLGISEEAVDYYLNDTLPSINNTLSDPSESLRNGFDDITISNGAYRFEIKTLGWYNVDAFVRGLPGTTLCDVTVKLDGEGAGERIDVYAFFPQQKNLSVGIRHTDGTYHFDKVDGKIPLYLNEKGTIVAFGNRGDAFFFGINHFTVSPSQTISVSMKKSDEDILLQAVKNEKIEGINMDIVKQKMVVRPGDSSNNSGRDTLLR